MDIEEIALRYGMKVNDNNERVNIVLDKIRTIKEKENAGYCPCMPQHNEDTICPCKYMRQYKVCRCGLYTPK